MSKSVLKKMATLIFSALFIKGLGFYFKIYLSKVAGAEGVGLYHLVLSVYALMASISSFGISQTLSRLIAYNEKYSKRILKTAIIMTGVISTSVFLTVFLNAEYIGINILKDSRVIKSIKIVAFSFPAIAIFSSVAGYFNGLTKVKYASNGQIIEQIIRILFVMLFLKKGMQSGIESGMLVLSFGIVLGEYISAMYIFFSYIIFSRNKKDAYTKRYFIKDILKISIPVSSGGYISSFLHTVENIVLREKLVLSGLTNTQSVSVLGLAKGMAAPIIFFPALITNAVSILTLPKISKEQSLCNYKKIKRITKKALCICFFTGLISAFVFKANAEKICFFLYSSYDCTVFVKNMSLALPFMFFNITASGILNGIGKHFLVLGENLLINLTKLLMIIIFVGKIGIKGYFFALFFSEFLGFIMYFMLIYKHIYKKY